MCRLTTCGRRTAASTAPMPNARPWRRGQSPRPRSGASKAQGLTAAIAVVAPSDVPFFALKSTSVDGPIGTSTTAGIYTTLTDVTRFARLPLDALHGQRLADAPPSGHVSTLRNSEVMSLCVLASTTVTSSPACTSARSCAASAVGRGGTQAVPGRLPTSHTGVQRRNRSDPEDELRERNKVGVSTLAQPFPGGRQSPVRE